MEHKLRLIYAEGATQPHLEVSVEARVSLVERDEAKTLRVQYDVRGPALNADPSLPKDDSVWELWNFDVVEVFLTATPPAPYFEFQVSPYGQRLELNVVKPRVDVDRGYRCPGLKVEAEVLEDTALASRWRAQLEIPLGQHQGPWVGGLFAILGKPGSRLYFASFLEPVPPGGQPDYHQPAHFQRLV